MRIRIDNKYFDMTIVNLIPSGCKVTAVSHVLIELFEINSAIIL